MSREDTAAAQAVAVRPPALHHQITEGVQWLWSHRGLGALTGCITVMNLTFMAAFATWVLYGTQRLGLTLTPLEVPLGLVVVVPGVRVEPLDRLPGSSTDDPIRSRLPGRDSSRAALADAIPTRPPVKRLHERHNPTFRPP